MNEHDLSLYRRLISERDAEIAQARLMREEIDDAMRSYEMTGNVTALTDRVRAACT